MGRHVDAKCRLCRREGMKLFLKGARCYTPKCGVAKREYPPGRRSWRRSKPGEFALQLREKQKVKRHYWVREQQFRRYFDIAERTRGNTGALLLVTLERRLDNCLFRGGFALSRVHARQLIRHGHITVNGGKVNIPSFLLKPGDVIGVRHAEKLGDSVKAYIEAGKARGFPSWLTIEEANLTIAMSALPSREEVEIPVQEQLIVELCSK